MARRTLPFGSNGTVATSVAGGGGVRDIAVDPGGRMVVVGWAGWGYSGSVLVARYLDGGTLDGSFGGAASAA